VDEGKVIDIKCMHNCGNHMTEEIICKIIENDEILL